MSDEITEDEMKDIIDYINGWDYDKYKRDLEIKEALQLLKNKMIKDSPQTKAQPETEQEKQAPDNVDTKANNDYHDNFGDCNAQGYQDQTSPGIIEGDIKELTDEEKIALEKGWNNSVKIDNNYNTTIGNESTRRCLNPIYEDQEIFKDIRSKNSFNKWLQKHGIMPIKHEYYFGTKITVCDDKRSVYKESSATYPFIYGNPIL